MSYTTNTSWHPSKSPLNGWCASGWGRLIIAVVLILLAAGQPTARAFSGGNGTAENPYLVATVEDLDAVRLHREAAFRQVAELDVADETGTGEGWMPLGNATATFRGIYDGAGLAIRNLRIARPSESCQGLFGVVDGATIRGVVLGNATVTAHHSSGLLAGRVTGSGVNECRAEGTLDGSDFSGGLVGVLVNGTLSDSQTEVTVRGAVNVGGLVGYASGSQIARCASLGSVSGRASVGGLVGKASDHEPASLPAVAEFFPASGAPGSSVWIRFAAPIVHQPEEIRAACDGEAVPVTLIGDDVIETRIPSTATGGVLTMLAGLGPAVQVTFPLTAHSETPLLEQAVSPSATAQTITTADGNLTLTLPPGFLETASTVKMGVVTGIPTIPADPRVTAGIEVSVDGHEALDEVVEIGIKIAPPAADPEVPVAGQFAVVRWDEDGGSWVDVPSTYDEATQTLRVQTRHLSVFAVFGKLAAAVSIPKVIGAVAVITAPLWVVDPLTLHTYTTPEGNFSLMYYKKVVDAIEPGWTKPSLSGLTSYSSAHPKAIQDLGAVFEVALAHYIARGFLDPTKTTSFLWGTTHSPLHVKVSSTWTRLMGLARLTGLAKSEEDPQYEKFIGTIHIPVKVVKELSQPKTEKSASATLGHELFHRIQAKYFQPYHYLKISPVNAYWWIETTAEFAGCREAWGANDPTRDDKFSVGIPGNFLTFPLNSTGPHDEAANDHEYQTAVFIRYLVDKMGISFPDMFRKVSEKGGTLSALDTYLRETLGPTDPTACLSTIYREFARYASLSQESFLRGRPLAKFFPDTEEKKSNIASQLNVVDRSKAGGLMKIKVSGDNALVDVFVLPENAQTTGNGHNLPRRVLQDGEEFELRDIPDGQVLYLLAENASLSADHTFTATIEPVANPAPPDAPKLTYSFVLPKNGTSRVWAIKLVGGMVENWTQKKYFDTINAALATASKGDKILVGTGIYDEVIEIANHRVSLVADNRLGPVVIRSQATSGYAVRFSGKNPATLFQGFTITGPGTTDFWSPKTRGIVVRGGATPKIKANSISGFDIGISVEGAGAPTILMNTLTKNGYGIADDDAGSPNDPPSDINTNTLEENKNGIGIRNSSATITGNTVKKNSPYGGIVVWVTKPSAGAVSIVKNTVTNNENSYGGGGIYLTYDVRAASASATVSDNTVFDNATTSSGGGIAVDAWKWTPPVSIVGNKVVNNRASYSGGGIWAQASVIAGNTVTANRATQYGGGIYGYAPNWGPRLASVSVRNHKTSEDDPEFRIIQVLRHSAPFPHAANFCIGNSAGEMLEHWGPDNPDNPVPFSAADVYLSSEQ